MARLPVLTRGRVMLLALACLVGVVLVSWAAVSGPVVTDENTDAAPASVVPSPVVSLPSASASASPTPSPRRSRQVGPAVDLSWIRYVVVGLLLAGALLLLVRNLPRLGRFWRELSDTGPPQEHVDLGVLPGAEDVGRALAADREGQLTAIEAGDPRNGIVAAWHRLEETTAASGLPRKGWETSAEFTVRMLKGLDVDPRSAGELAELYRLARFSSRTVDEAQRERARAALDHLHDDLRMLR